MSDHPDYAAMDFAELGRELARAGADSPASRGIMVDLVRRQTVAQIQAAEAQERAATASIRNTRYMLLSVVIALGSLAVSVWVALESL